MLVAKIKEIFLAFTAVSLLLIAISTPSVASDASAWTWEDTGLQAVLSGLIIADWTQTLYIARNNCNKYYYELPSGYTPTCYKESVIDDIIGESPSKRDVNRYFFLTLISHTTISYLLPKPYRSFWQGLPIYIEYNIVQRNRSAGIGISFHF